MPIERPYEVYELKIKAWEGEKYKEIAESDIVRLSETVLPDGSVCMQHQLIKTSLFAISLEVEGDYQVLNINSDYLDSFAKLTEILNELMFGNPPQPQATVYPGGMQHGGDKPPDAEELDEEQKEELDDSKTKENKGKR